jgi:hypothetical protein
MNRQNGSPARWARNQEAEDDRVLKTVLIYENFAVGVRARRFFEELVRASAKTLEEQMWNFDVLGIRDARNAAASAARKSDVVAVAVSGRLDLPGTIRAWLDMWLWLLEDEKPPLVALFDSPSAPELPRIHTHLSCVVARAGIEFFSAQRQVSLVPAVGVVGSRVDGIWPASVERALLAKLSPRFAHQGRPSV